MICVFFAPKGGTGKTSLVYQLSFHLSDDTEFLDLDANGGLSEHMSLNQPAPKDITLPYVKKLLPQFYTKDLLIVDCGGYQSLPIIECMARSDIIIFPMCKGKTNSTKPAVLQETLDTLSKDLNHNFTANMLWNRLPYNQGVGKLSEPYSHLDRIKPLPFGIESNTQIADLEQCNVRRL